MLLLLRFYVHVSTDSGIRAFLARWGGGTGAPRSQSLLRAYGLGAVVSRGGMFCIGSPPLFKSPQEMTALSVMDLCTFTE